MTDIQTTASLLPVSVGLSALIGDDSAGQMLLVFHLQGEVFAIGVDHVHAVIDPLPVTIVPHAPDYAPGLVNFRGQIIPVIDLRKRLAMPDRRDAADRERMIVIDQMIAEQRTRLAFVTDSVDEVIETDMAGLQTMPELGARWPARMITGIARHDDRMVILLNHEAVFATDAPASANLV